MQFVALALVFYPLYKCARKRWRPVAAATAVPKLSKKARKAAAAAAAAAGTTPTAAAEPPPPPAADWRGWIEFAATCVWNAASGIFSLGGRACWLTGRVFRCALYCVCSGAAMILTLVVVVALFRPAPLQLPDESEIFARIAADAEL